MTPGFCTVLRKRLARRAGATVGFAALIAAGLGQAAPEVLSLAVDGDPRMPIMAGSVEEPVAELRDALRRITGAEFEVAKAVPGTCGIFVGLAADFPWVSPGDLGSLGAEGFVLRSEGGSLYLVADRPRGVQHAVTTFLHRLGCRWFFPGEAWEVIPEHKTICGNWNERHIPSFPTQRRIWYGFGAYAKGKHDLSEWERHNRMGGPVEISIGHTWHGLQPERDFAAHPEWFAEVGGKRQPSKPCYRHPAVLQRAIESARQQAAQGKEMISMTPPDGLGYCECERCRQVCGGAETFRDHQSLFALRPDGVLVNVTSETLFAFVNKVAEAVAAEHPKTMIGCYAYSAYSHPPSFDLHENVYLQTTTAFRRTPMALEEQIAAFGRKTKQVGIRDYYSVYQWDWDYPDPGKMTPGALARDLRIFQGNGVTAINAEASNNWAARGPGYYLAAQLLWNIDADVNELLRDFYEKAFGPAALAMQRYYVRWGGADFAALPDPRGTPKQRLLYVKGVFDADALRAAYRDLDEAANAVPPDSRFRERIDLIRLYGHYLFLRWRLHLAEAEKDPRAIVEAIKAETTFGGRLADTHMIHARPLLGKAFLRRFARHEELLKGSEGAPPVHADWRQCGTPPSREELEELWKADQRALSRER